MLEGKYTAGGKIKIKYLERNLVSVRHKPWANEMSGRLLSLAMDIRDRANASAEMLNKRSKKNPPAFKFRHILYAQVGPLRCNGAFDVIYSPTWGNTAHADLVMLHDQTIANRGGGFPKPAHDLFRELQDLLSVLPEDNLYVVEALRRPNG